MPADRRLRVAPHVTAPGPTAADPERLRSAELGCGWDFGWLCLEAGSAYERGDGVPQDLRRAVGLYEKGCHDEAAGCLAAARLLESPDMPLETFVRVSNLYIRACEAGGPARACTQAALLSANGPRSAENREFDRRELELGCLRGDEDGCRAFEQLGFGKAPSPLPPRAEGVPPPGVAGDLWGQPDARWLEERCAQASPRSCFRLGTKLVRGDGVPRDPRRAARLLRTACDHAYDAACIALAAGSDSGFAQLDFSRVPAILEKGCAAGDASACFALGLCHAEARLVPRDAARAAELLQRGCTLGSKASCTDLKLLPQILTSSRSTD